MPTKFGIIFHIQHRCKKKQRCTLIHRIHSHRYLKTEFLTEKKTCFFFSPRISESLRSRSLDELTRIQKRVDITEEQFKLAKAGGSLESLKRPADSLERFKKLGGSLEHFNERLGGSKEQIRLVGRSSIEKHRKSSSSSSEEQAGLSKAAAGSHELHPMQASSAPGCKLFLSWIFILILE